MDDVGWSSSGQDSSPRYGREWLIEERNARVSFCMSFHLQEEIFLRSTERTNEQLFDQTCCPGRLEGPVTRSIDTRSSSSAHNARHGTHVIVSSIFSSHLVGHSRADGEAQGIRLSYWNLSIGNPLDRIRGRMSVVLWCDCFLLFVFFHANMLIQEMIMGYGLVLREENSPARPDDR